MATATKQNWFDTLNQALESEGLVSVWPLGSSLNYGDTYRFTYDDGSKHGHLVSVFRETDGRYERPVHYNIT